MICMTDKKLIMIGNLYNICDILLVLLFEVFYDCCDIYLNGFRSCTKKVKKQLKCEEKAKGNLAIIATCSVCGQNTEEHIDIKGECDFREFCKRIFPFYGIIGVRTRESYKRMNQTTLDRAEQPNIDNWKVLIVFAMLITVVNRGGQKSESCRLHAGDNGTLGCIFNTIYTFNIETIPGAAITSLNTGNDMSRYGNPDPQT
uniref:Uncharacterized protein n=1 Tax=Glossina brevipalpis TaxID=37001 RepID=A0A1A9WIG5_9MUSC